MNDFQPLGPRVPVPVPAPEAEPDRYDRIIGQHGDVLWRNRRTGAYRTDQPGLLPAIPARHTPAVDFILDALQERHR